MRTALAESRDLIQSAHWKCRNQPLTSDQGKFAMDQSAISANSFHIFAERYREKYMELTLYDDSYREFCELLPRGRARVLDVACGPGNVSRYLIKQKPDLELLGIDLAPGMVELARKAVPSAQFAVHDCRHLAELNRRFDGIICAFGLPYLSREEARAFIAAAAGVLEPEGVLYLSTMLSESEDSGLYLYGKGDQVYQVFVNYYREDEVAGILVGCGLTITSQKRIISPSNASKPTTDLIVVARK
jgi:ubiquinone/menaquinone biosynthesis C-methylase UbiE